MNFKDMAKVSTKIPNNFPRSSLKLSKMKQQKKTSKHSYLKVKMKHLGMSGSAGRACDYWSHSYEFELYVGRTDYLKK